MNDIERTTRGLDENIISFKSRVRPERSMKPVKFSIGLWRGTTDEYQIMSKYLGPELFLHMGLFRPVYYDSKPAW